MKVTLMLFVVLGTFHMAGKSSFEEMEIRRRNEIIQGTALLKLTFILRRFLEIEGDLLSLRLQS